MATAERTLTQIHQERRDLLQQISQLESELKQRNLEVARRWSLDRPAAYWSRREDLCEQAYSRLLLRETWEQLVARLREHPLIAPRVARDPRQAERAAEEAEDLAASARGSLDQALSNLREIRALANDPTIRELVQETMDLLAV